MIDENNEQAGILKTRDALALARQRNLDLVEVAPNAQPPVCRLLDYGKYRYEQTKKERDARKTQKVISVKEVRLRPKIDDNDLNTKGRQAKVFLEEGHKVKMTVLFRGRELAHTEIGRDLLNEMIEKLKDTAVIEQAPKMEGKNMTMLLSKQAAKGQPSQPASARPANTATLANENRPPRLPQAERQPEEANGKNNPVPSAPTPTAPPSSVQSDEPEAAEQSKA